VRRRGVFAGRQPRRAPGGLLALVLSGLTVAVPVLASGQTAPRSRQSTLVFESSEVAIFEKACGKFRSVGSNIFEVVFKRADPAYEVSPDNPDYRRLFEQTIYPIVERRCRHLNLKTVVANFVAGIHLAQDYAESATPVANRIERSLNEVVVLGQPSAFDYRFGGYRTVAAMRTARDGARATADAAREARANRAAAAEASTRAAAAEAVARSDADRARILPTLAPAVRTWYSGILESKAAQRGEYFRSLGGVRVEYKAPLSARAALSQAAALAAITEALSAVGLRVDPGAPAVVDVEVDLGSTLIVTTTGEYQREQSLMTPVWVTASTRLPATVAREGGFRRTLVTLASATAGEIEKGEEPTYRRLRPLVGEAIALMARDAALDAAGVTDAEWRRHLSDAARIGRAPQLHADWVASTRTTLNGRMTSLDGVRGVARINLKTSPFNRVPMFDLRENFLGTGIDFWQGESVWRKALADAGVAAGASTVSGRYLPILDYRVSGTSALANVVDSQETTLVGGMGEAALIEPHCLVPSVGGLARLACKTWQGHHGGAGLPGTGHIDSKDHVFRVLDGQMATMATTFARLLRSSRDASAPAPAIAPATTNTPRGAYDRLNAGRPANAQQPLLFRKGRAVYLAGIDPATAELKVMEVPLQPIRDYVREGELSRRRHANHPLATRENLFKGFKERYEVVRFAYAVFPHVFSGMDDLADAASRAPDLGLDYTPRSY
jgi:hypothetical protein